MTNDNPRKNARPTGAAARMRLGCVRALVAAAFVATSATIAMAQNPAPQGVHLGMRYDGNGRPGVALLPITGLNADSVHAILARDLDFSDRINVIVPDSSDSPAGPLNYKLYAKMTATAVVQAAVTPAGALHVAVHDVGDGRVAQVMDLPLPEPAFSREWRRAVHMAADSVEWVVLGQSGISSTRIAYATRGGPIQIVDADGAGLYTLPGTVDCLSPAWDSTGRRMACNALPTDKAPSRIIVRDLQTGIEWSTRVGAMNQTAAFSPDGSMLVFSSGSDGSDLYAIKPFSGEAPRRLTSRRSTLNMSPTFSPDGRRIAFTSSILGHPEVYIMDADGSSVDLLTSSGFGDDLYRSNPSWSPDGRRVAFQSRIKGIDQVMTISVRDKSTTQLTSEGKNEDPSWAPDGRHIVFVSNRTGTPELWVMDTESSRSRQLTHRGRAQNPAWSPRLGISRQP